MYKHSYEEYEKRLCPQYWPEINNLFLEHLLLGNFLLFCIIFNFQIFFIAIHKIVSGFE